MKHFDDVASLWKTCDIIRFLFNPERLISSVILAAGMGGMAGNMAAPNMTPQQSMMAMQQQQMAMQQQSLAMATQQNAAFQQRTNNAFSSFGNLKWDWVF